MTSPELFIKRLRNKINEDVQRIIKKAETESQEIIKDAEQYARRLISEIVSSKIIKYKREILSKKELELRRELFKIKNEIFNTISEIATRKIKKIVEENVDNIYYNKIFYELLKESCEKLGEIEVIVQANEKDLEWLSKNKQRVELRLSEDIGLPIKITLSEDIIETLGGVIVYSKDGKKYYINTIESRLNFVLEKYRKNIGQRIKKVLEKYGIKGV